MKKLYPLYLLLLLCCSSISLQAQLRETLCDKLMTSDYISDGQYYTTDIKYGEIKDREITFIAGTEYRITLCSDKSKNIQMQLIDIQGNILFDNKDFNYINYWNFKINETINCIVRLRLTEDIKAIDNITILTGFKI